MLYIYIGTAIKPMANYHLNITQLLPQLSMYKPVCFC